MVKTKLLSAKIERLNVIMKRHDYSNVLALTFINKEKPNCLNQGYEGAGIQSD